MKVIISRICYEIIDNTTGEVTSAFPVSYDGNDLQLLFAYQYEFLLNADFSKFLQLLRKVVEFELSSLVENSKLYDFVFSVEGVETEFSTCDSNGLCCDENGNTFFLSMSGYSKKKIPIVIGD